MRQPRTTCTALALAANLVMACGDEQSVAGPSTVASSNPPPAASPTVTSAMDPGSAQPPATSGSPSGSSAAGEGVPAGPDAPPSDPSNSPTDSESSPLVTAPHEDGGTGEVAGSDPQGSAGRSGVGGTPAPTDGGAAQATEEPAPDGNGGGGGGAGDRLPPSDDPASWGGEPRCAGLALCESFESVEPGALPQDWQLGGYGERTVASAQELAMRGERALRIEVPQSSNAVVAMIGRDAPAELAVSHWGRQFVHIRGPAESQFVHYDLFAGTGPWMGYTHEVRWAVTGTGVGTSSSHQSFIYNVQPSGEGAPGEFGTEGDRSAHPRVDDWMCLEWYLDAEGQQARFFLDGTEVSYLSVEGQSAQIPEFERLSVGFQKFQSTGAFVVFIDEVAFHDERIGCNN